MRTRFAALLASAMLLSGCSAVPNLDHGSAGCANAQGIGPRAGAQTGGAANSMRVMAQLHGAAPTEAAEVAGRAGHTVVFNTDGVCWCEPPPDGTVTESWWGQNGQLHLWVDGATIPAEDPPFLGWGC